MANVIGFKMDGVEYSIEVISLEREFAVLDTDKADRNTNTGVMMRDVIGTFYNYTIAIDKKGIDRATYDTFYEQLTSPNFKFHSMVFPYGQTTLSFQAYATTGKDKLFKDSDGNNNWDGLTVQFIAKEPQRVPT